MGWDEWYGMSGMGGERWGGGMGGGTRGGMG